MYCPKCKQTFEEGSRRFCPTDGTRLVSDASPQRQGGVFANLIPEMDAISDLGSFPRSNSVSKEASDPTMQFSAKTENAGDELLFELDDDDSVGQPMNEAAFAEAARKFESLPAGDRSLLSEKPAPRKVNPYEISDGGVNLEEDRPEIFTGDFDVSNPESFVNRVVKGRYKVTEFLGGDEGGLAYVGRDKIADRKVLVRILLQEESDEIMASILAEERVSLSHLVHPNIARLIDSGTFTNGIQFLVSEYVDALSVRDILDIHGKFTPERTGRIARQAASALAQAHQEGILHRDVRPENFILDTDGEVEQLVLVNFGASNGEPTEMNAAYKAPEVLDGRIATAASDIFSLGVVVYEMLTGRLPFEGESTKDIVRSQYNGLSLRPSDVQPDLPAEVDEVLEKAFSFNASERYTKAREFGDALHAALSTTAPLPTIKVRATGAGSAAKPVVTGTETLHPAVKSGEPAWKSRSPEPPEVEDSGKRTAWLVAIAILVGLLALGWWY
ncbi:MAG TPA: serine/threonine-protein kinase, partial [Pyrinomonadaceae bacterium]|nr:serine/threonine-protein kinase [Pyrinomonadaceae bacterium]